MDSTAITTAILTHPIQVLLMAAIAGRLVRMAFSSSVARGAEVRPAELSIASAVLPEAA